MNNMYILCLLVAVCWSGAPFLGRISQLNPSMMVIAIVVGSLIPILPIALYQNFSLVSTRALSFGVAGGIINALGLIAWYRLVSGSNDGLWELSSVLPIAIVLMAVMLVVGGKIFFGESFTVNKTIGLVLASGAIWFLR